MYAKQRISAYTSQFSMLNSTIFKRGRPGMDLLVIVLLAGLKHATDMDYDRLTTWANQMGVLRQIMEPRISSGIVVSVFMIMCQNVL